MDLIAFVDDLQSAYVTEFVASYERESGKPGQFFSEIAFKISGSVHKGFYVADFVRRAEGSDAVVELGETPSTLRGPASLNYAEATVIFDAVSWDAIEISTQPSVTWSRNFETWFERWLDVEKVPKDGEIVTGIIHSVAFANGGIQVDFGTAPPEAAIELIGLLHENGAQVIRFANARE